MTIKVILGSVRSARAGKAVADWVMAKIGERKNSYDYELIDLKVLDLPWFDEPAPPMMGVDPIHESTKNWAEIVESSDAFVFITPEYNHGYSPVLKNAIDHLYKEWREKPAAFVGYGGSGARSAINQLRLVLDFIGLKLLPEQVGVNEIWQAIDENGSLKEDAVSGDLNRLLDQLEEAIREGAALETAGSPAN